MRTIHLSSGLSLLVAIAIILLAAVPERIPPAEDPQRFLEPDIQKELEQRFDAPSSGLPFPDDHVDAARRAYVERNFRPIWTGSPEAVNRTEALLNEVGQAHRYALRPGAYALEEVRRGLARAYDEALPDDEAAAERLADAELHLASLFLDFGEDIAEGPFSPSSVGERWHVDETDSDLGQALARVETEGVIDVLESLASRHDSYFRLQDALERYREYARNGGFPHIPAGDLVRPGEKSERVLDVHRRLAAEDYDVGPAPEDSVLNESLGDAVAEFQRRHGLVIDRIIGPSTRAAMNVPASDRVRQIEVNLVRWHWMPVDLGGRHLFVNLPEYRLHAYDNGQEVLSMKVVVGADYDQRATPAFSDEVTYAQFKPYWNVPMSIARDELVPRGPEDLRKSGFEIVPEFGVSEDEVLPMTDENLEAVAEGQHFLRERPGPTNALGRVKYMFPNEFAIYLHDTPEDHLFEERERTFSHGCIRVEDPAALGAFLFQPRDWSEREIRRRMNEGPKNQRVDLRQPVPVFILYFTAFVDESGDVHFRPDVYGYDEPIREALAAREIREPDVSIEELTGLLP